ncbi:MAG TPA: DUF5906 domain-containing protein [Nevskiaceae bacterium]|nr:DUF5906 domain-containing protein [Nevskiaceae bacterium]
MFANYDDALAQLRSFSLDVQSLDVDTTRPVRCREVDGDRERRGWYWLHSFRRDGDDGITDYIVGSYGVWRGADANTQKIKLGKVAAKLTAQEREAIAARQRESKARAKAQRNTEIARAARAAQIAWSKYVTAGESDYLAKKGVAAHGLRYSPTGNGTLAVPMADAAGRLHGLQIIRSQAKRKLQKEYWPRGLDKIGTFHLIGTPQPGGVLLLCEGYATGATLFEATNLPCAVAFDAGNLIHAAEALAKAFTGVHILVCADDDYMATCRACQKRTRIDDANCQHCGQPHGQQNTGVECARTSAFAVHGASVAPAFPFDRQGAKLTDYNDLAQHPQAGPHLVKAQIWDAIRAQGWTGPRAAPCTTNGGGEGDRTAVAIMGVDALVDRFVFVDDGTGKAAFDKWRHRIVNTAQIVSMLPPGARWDDVKRHPAWASRAHFIEGVGFDPAGEDPRITLNLWQGLSSVPKAGDCSRMVELLEYLCSGEENSQEMQHWLTCFFAYPLQHPGAKLQSAAVIYGPQGTGKSTLAEAVSAIYGEYAITLTGEVLEDRFNDDLSGKLFAIADEMVAQSGRYQVKNTLKTLITGQQIRINPKNLAARTERNHLNVIFLSNEVMPLVLEGDDRRHGVIRTPPKLSQSFYAEVRAQLKSGGLEAFHQYLLGYDCGDFDVSTQPPDSRSKRDLKELGLSSVESFVRDWVGMQLHGADGQPVPLAPCASPDLYRLYRGWCQATGERDLGMRRLLGHLRMRGGWHAGEVYRVWTNDATGTTTKRLVVPSDKDTRAAVEADESQVLKPYLRDKYSTERDWLTASMRAVAAGAHAQ